MSWQWRMIQNLKRTWLVSSKLKWGIWRILTRALENLKNLHFKGLLLTKAYVWAKKSIWLHYRLIQNWKENWLVLSKMTWRISQIFIHRLKNSDFILERKMAELNKNIKFKTSRSTRCSVKNLFYLWNKWIVQLTKIFTNVLQNHCS